ncbi:MAG: response regulator [Planctomycetota bacterium]|nr:response regulator [Planctomycetota bacterium]MDA1140319.1 response regulator [Planctomycetota bacterium]
MSGDAPGQFRRAVEIYLNQAYGEVELPQRVRKRLEFIPKTELIQEILAADSFEVDKPDESRCEPCFRLRLGNRRYPHMKLVVQRISEQRFVYSVDTHDQHFDVPANSEEEDGLKKLRDFNGELKQRIEHCWRDHQITTFSGLLSSEMESKERAEGLPLIMLVEDEPDILEAEKQILELGGYYVLAFQDGKLAMDSIEGGGRPDLCMLDIMMRDIDGFQIRDAIREKFGPEVPIIFVSGLPVEALEKSGEEFLQKPFRGEDLLNKVEFLIKKS